VVCVAEHHCLCSADHFKYTDVSGGTKCVAKFAGGEIARRKFSPILTFRVPGLGMCYFTDAGQRHDHLALSMETVIWYMYMLLGRRIQSTSWRHSTEVTSM